MVVVVGGGGGNLEQNDPRYVYVDINVLFG